MFHRQGTAEQKSPLGEDGGFNVITGVCSLENVKLFRDLGWFMLYKSAVAKHRLLKPLEQR